MKYQIIGKNIKVTQGISDAIEKETGCKIDKRKVVLKDAIKKSNLEFNLILFLNNFTNTSIILTNNWIYNISFFIWWKYQIQRDK